MFPGWFAVRSGRPREVPAAPASSGLETHRPCPWALISYLLISLLVCLCHRPHFGSPQRLAYKGALLRGAGGGDTLTYHPRPSGPADYSFSSTPARQLRGSLSLSLPPSNGRALPGIFHKYLGLSFTSSGRHYAVSRILVLSRICFISQLLLAKDGVGLIFGPSV